MAAPVRYKGEDIFVGVTITDDITNLPINLANLDALYVYCYTSPNQIQKFSRDVATGFTQLTRVSDTYYTGYITGATTNTWGAGSIVCEIYVDQTTMGAPNGNITLIGSAVIAELTDNQIGALNAS